MSKELTQDGNAALITPLIDPEPTPEVDPPDINIQSPTDGALVVGTIPGVVLTVSGSGWTPLRSKPAVKVKIGATDTFHDAASVTTPNLGGELLLDLHGRHRSWWPDHSHCTGDYRHRSLKQCNSQH